MTQDEKKKSRTKKVESFCHTWNILQWGKNDFKIVIYTNGDYFLTFYCCLSSSFSIYICIISLLIGPLESFNDTWGVREWADVSKIWFQGLLCRVYFLPCKDLIPLSGPDARLCRVDRIFGVQFVDPKSGFGQGCAGCLQTPAVNGHLLLLALTCQTTVYCFLLTAQ